MNFFVECNGGDPGGESGILKFGTEGRVRVRIIERVAVYGDPGAVSSCAFSEVGGGVTVGPIAGPLRGPCSVEDCGIGTGVGAGAGSDFGGVGTVVLASACD